MFVDIPPPAPPPPALTAVQRADLECLQVGRMVLAIDGPPHPRTEKMVRAYLARLRRTDDKRDWLAMAAAQPDMRYGEFISRLNSCMDFIESRPVRRRD